MPTRAIRFLARSLETVFLQHRMLSAEQLPVIFRELVNDRASLDVVRLMEQQVPPVGNRKAFPAMAVGFQFTAPSQHEQPVMKGKTAPISDTDCRFRRTDQKPDQHCRRPRFWTIGYQARLNREQFRPFIYREIFPTAAVGRKLWLLGQQLAPLQRSPFQNTGAFLEQMRSRLQHNVPRRSVPRLEVAIVPKLRRCG